MCLDAVEKSSSSGEGIDVEFEINENCPSVGLNRMKQLSREGGAHEIIKAVKKSVSTPDFKGYFDSMTSF